MPLSKEEYEKGLPPRFTREATDPEPEFSEADFNAINEEIWGEVGEYYPTNPPAPTPTVDPEDEEQEQLLGALLYGAQAVQTPSVDPNVLKTKDGKRVSISGFQDAPPTLLHREQQALEKAELEKLDNAPGFFDILPTARDEVWGGYALKRINERYQDDAFDVDYRTPVETIEKLAVTHTEQELEYISEATSGTNLKTRLGDIEADRKRRQILSSAGWSGIGAQLMLSILDPSAIILSGITAPLAASAQATRVGNMLRVGVVSAVENAAIEAVLVKGNTQANETDIYMAAGGGFILGGGLGSLARTDAVAKGKQGQVDGLDDIDFVANDIATRYQEARAMAQAEEVLNAQIASGVETKIAVRKMELSNQAGKPLGKPQRKQLEVNRAGHVKSLDTVKKAHELEVKRINAMKPTGRKKAKHTKARHKEAQFRALDKAEAKLISAQVSLSAKVDSIDMRLRASEERAQASIELQRWNKLTDQQKTDELFPYRTADFQERYVKSKLKRQESALKAQRADIKADQLKPGESPDGAPTGKDASAAKTKTPQYEPYANPRGRNEEIIDDMVEKTIKSEIKDGRTSAMLKYLPSWLRTDRTNIDRVDNIFARALNNMFNENAILGAGKTVSSITHANLSDIKFAGKGAYDRGLHMYAEESGINYVRAGMSTKFRESYNEQVVLAIKGINKKDLPPSIKLAAEGLSAQMAKATALRKQHGELGFTDLSTVANYFPDLMDAAKATNRFNRAGWGDEDAIQLLTKGYLQGDNSLTVRQAEAMAEIKYRNMADNQLVSIDDVNNVFRADSTKAARAVLTEAGFSKTEARELLEAVMDGDDWVQVSGRAKKSYHIDWEAKHAARGRTIKIKDLMDTNAGRVVESYSNESALGASLAEMGIKSRGQLERFMEDIQKASSNSAIWDKATAVKMKAEMDYAVDLVGNTLTQLGGKSLINYKSTANRVGRLVRDVTGIVRLQQIAFSTIPELSRGLTQVGLLNMLKAVPSSGIFRRPGNWKGRDANFELKNPQLRESEEILSFIGEKDLNASLHIRSEDSAVDSTNSLGLRVLNKLEEAGEMGKRMSGWMSGFNTVQGGIEKLVTNAINRKMINFALGKSKLSKSLTNQIEMTGMGEQWKAIQAWTKVNSGKDSFNGRSVDTWNYRNMPPEIKRDFQTMMQRLTRRAVQRTNAGEQNSLWLGPLGSFLTQFRSYTLGTIEKQLAADWRGDKAGMAINFLWSTGLSYVAYSLQVQLRASAMPDYKAEAYLDRAFGEGLIWGVLSKHSQLAALGVASDLAMATGTAPDEWYDSGRIGRMKSNPTGLIPALGLATDGMEAMGSIAEIGYEAVRDDGDVEEASKEMFKKVNRLTPFMDSLYMGESLRTLTGLNED